MRDRRERSPVSAKSNYPPCMDAQRSVVMKTPKNLGMILLAVWLILWGVLHFSISFS